MQLNEIRQQINKLTEELYIKKDGAHFSETKRKGYLRFKSLEPDRVPIYEYIYRNPLYKEVLGRVPDSYNAEAVVLCAR